MASCLAANETAAKVYYFLVFGLTVLVSWALRDYAQDALRHVPEIKTCFNNQVHKIAVHTAVSSVESNDSPRKPFPTGCIASESAIVSRFNVMTNRAVTLRVRPYK